MVVADALGELLVGPVDAEVDVEALAQEVDAGVGELLLDEDPVLLGERRSRRGRDAGLEEHPLGGADAGAVLDVVAELVQHHLQARRATVRMSKAPK